MPMMMMSISHVLQLVLALNVNDFGHVTACQVTFLNVSIQSSQAFTTTVKAELLSDENRFVNT